MSPSHIVISQLICFLASMIYINGAVFSQTSYFGFGSLSTDACFSFPSVGLGEWLYLCKCVSKLIFSLFLYCHAFCSFVLVTCSWMQWNVQYASHICFRAYSKVNVTRTNECISQMIHFTIIIPFISQNRSVLTV